MNKQRRRQESVLPAKPAQPSSPLLSDGPASAVHQDDSSKRCKSSSLIEKIKQAAQVTAKSDQVQEAHVKDAFFEEDESIRALLQVSGVQDASKKDWVSMIDMVCNSLI